MREDETREPVAEVLSQGDEVVTGQVVDSNAAWISERLTDLGFEVRRHVAVLDDRDEIAAVFREAVSRADLVVATGGLGPTDDDLTALAISDAFGVRLELDDEALRAIEGFYERLGREMPAVNRKQALLPRGSRRLDNDAGTAPGFALDLDERLVACLPGVPREMKRMFDARLEPLVRALFRVAPRPLVTLRCAGIGESNLQEKLGTIADDRFVVSFRTKLPENHLKLRFHPRVAPDERAAVARELAARIGRAVFAIEGTGEPGGSLEQVTARRLEAVGGRLAAVEGASGGRLASACVSRPGAARWFRGAVVLGPDDADGSEADLLAHARKARERLGATHVVANGPFVPDEREDRGATGRVALALVHPEGELARTVTLFGDAERLQGLAAGANLDALRRVLEDRGSKEEVR